MVIGLDTCTMIIKSFSISLLIPSVENNMGTYPPSSGKKYRARAVKKMLTFKP